MEAWGPGEAQTDLNRIWTKTGGAAQPSMAAVPKSPGKRKAAASEHLMADSPVKRKAEKSPTTPSKRPSTASKMHDGPSPTKRLNFDNRSPAASRSPPCDVRRSQLQNGSKRRLEHKRSGEAAILSESTSSSSASSSSVTPSFAITSCSSGQLGADLVFGSRLLAACRT